MTLLETIEPNIETVEDSLDKETSFKRAICLHEASHAIIGFYSGFSIESIKIDVSKEGSKSMVNTSGGTPEQMGILKAAGIVALEEEFGIDWLNTNNRKQIIFEDDLNFLHNLDEEEKYEIFAKTRVLYSKYRDEILSVTSVLARELETDNKIDLNWNRFRKIKNANA